MRPLAQALARLDLRVWYDEFSLKVGDSLSDSIDRGLSDSAFGAVILSPAFVAKSWPKHELRGLVARDLRDGSVILPIWHGVTFDDVISLSPPLADRMAIDTSRTDPAAAALQILQVVRPDIYDRHPRAKLLSMAGGEALRILQEEVDRMRNDLAATQEELSEYRCRYCGSPLDERVNAPADPDQKHWADHEMYACGYSAFGGVLRTPCPSDPRFPKFTDFDVHFRKEKSAEAAVWCCFPVATTTVAAEVRFGPSFGRTKAEARRQLRKEYARRARKWHPQDGAVCTIEAGA